MNSSLYIDSYQIEDDRIKISAIKNDIDVDYDLTVVQFEAFIDRHDKREYCNDSCDYSGEHVQDVGTLTWEEYYASDYVAKDLIEFITIREASYVFDEISLGISKIVAMVPNYSKASNF